MIQVAKKEKASSTPIPDSELIKKIKENYLRKAGISERDLNQVLDSYKLEIRFVRIYTAAAAVSLEALGDNTSIEENGKKTAVSLIYNVKSSLDEDRNFNCGFKEILQWVSLLP